jgi:hypothetical protein
MSRTFNKALEVECLHCRGKFTNKDYHLLFSEGNATTYDVGFIPKDRRIIGCICKKCRIKLGVIDAL